MMNKIKLALLLFIPLMFGCKKVLDTAPFSSITDASAFSTVAKCALALNGVYDAAQGDYYVTGTTEVRGYPFGAANIYQSDARGEDVVNVQAFLQVTYQATYNATNANSAAMWKGLYELINKANVAIDGFRKASGSVIPATGTNSAVQYEGECRFLRALAHHECVQHFARPYLENAGASLGVPWRDFPINSTAAVNSILNTPRATVATIYANCLTDLDYAETNLPAATGGISYRATKGAAIALKMRLKLEKGDWAGVIAEGAKLVPAVVTPTNPPGTISPIGGFALTASPDGPFVNNNSIESIFSIKNDPIDAPSTNGGLSRLYGAASLGGRGLLSISPIIYNDSRFLCDDKRKTVLLSLGTTALGGTGAANSAYFTNKYRDYTTWGDYAPQIRYAEVLLTLAEAEARNSGAVTQRAVDLLNVVRNRSLNTPAAQAYTLASFANQTALVTAILFERRVEFLAEGRRWGDISRLANDPSYTTGGIPAKAANGTIGQALYVCNTVYVPGQLAIAYSDAKFLWPIPITEIQTNPIIVQNPGY